MLRDPLLYSTDKVLMSVCKFGVLAHIFASFDDTMELIGVIRVVFDKGIVFLVEHFQNNLRIG